MHDGRALAPGLPYVPASFSGELLSSWLRRVAIDYGVDLPHLAWHIGLSVSRASVIDQGLLTNDVRRAASVLRSTPAELRAMMHASPTKVLAPTTLLLQLCLTCRTNHQAMTRAPVSIRTWFELWSVECDHCGTPFSPPGPPHLDRVNPAREEPLWFEGIRNAARAGARKLADFARRPFMTGWSPLTLLRLLSMRLNAGVFRNGTWRDSLTNHRVAELFVPGLASLRSANLIPEPWTAERPVRLVTARTILFAGMAEAFKDRPATVDLLWSVAPGVRNLQFRPLTLHLSRHSDESHVNS